MRNIFLIIVPGLSLLFLSTCRTLPLIPYPVKGGTRFEFFHTAKSEKAMQIQLLGSWNGWKKGVHVMHSIGRYYWLEIELPEGRHQYTFLTESGSNFLPENVSRRIPDGFGNYNGFLSIGGEGNDK